MNSKIIIIIAFCAASLTAVAQGGAPNMDAIRDSISNPSSSFYYPELFGRYQVLDTTLTLEHYHYLYYGYCEQPTYMPLLDNSARKELEFIIDSGENPTAEDYKRAIALTKAILEIEPFNPRDINALAYLYAMTGNEVEAEKLGRSMSMIIATIMSSGSGVSRKSPWWITYFNHAEDVLSVEGLIGRTPIILSRSIEFIPVKNMPKKKQKGVYFNYSEIYSRDVNYLDGVSAPKRKMNFNQLENTPKFTY